MSAVTNASPRGGSAASKAGATTEAGAASKTASSKSAASKATARSAGLPQRVQLKRSAGWKMPANTVKVDRTTRWGNPFTIAECGSAAIAVAQHGRWMRGEIGAPGGLEPPARDMLRSALAGRNLACWCRLPEHAAADDCHAAILLELANG